VAGSFTGALNPDDTATVQVNKIANQASAGNATMAAETQAHDGTAYRTVESAQATVTYADGGGVQVQAIVARSLEFAFSGPKSYVLVADPVSRRDVRFGDNALTVKTNADSYVVTVAADHNLRRADGAEIPAFSATAASPADWAGGSSVGLAYTVSGANADPKWGGGTKYAGITAAGSEVLAGSATGDAGHAVTVSYRLGVDYSVKAGTYSNTVRFVVTPTYSN